MATAAARLAAIEAGLTPTQLVVRWLDEAHAYGSLDAYVPSLLDGPDEDFPLDRLLREAKATRRRPTSTNRRADPDAPLWKVLLETAFRFELVLRIKSRPTSSSTGRSSAPQRWRRTSPSSPARRRTPPSPVGWPRVWWHPTPA